MARESYRTHRNASEAKRRRREEAEQRNAEWAQVNTADKLAILAARPGECKKQRARLLKLIEKQPA